MDKHVGDFFRESATGSPLGNFSKVIRLHEAPHLDWETIHSAAPSLCRGWYELAHLPVRDRIQFSLDYWLTKIPYHPHLDDGLSRFFGSMDDIGIFLTQRKKDGPFEVCMVYSMSGDRGFYRGCPAASEDEIINLQKVFSDYILPDDYLAFLQLHSGFCKTTDMTGITCASKLYENYRKFQGLLNNQGVVRTKSGKEVDPKTLIPFYESFGMPFYQCFWDGWHPEQEMGNVYYSAESNTISDPTFTEEASMEQMTFPTFSEWLLFYLEQIDF